MTRTQRRPSGTDPLLSALATIDPAGIERSGTGTGAGVGLERPDSQAEPLRELHRDLTAAEIVRARLTLDRILATDPSTPGAVATAVTATGSTRRSAGRSPAVRRRVLVPIGLVAAATVVAVVASTVAGRPAYADWTPVPEPLTPAQTQQAVEACRNELTPVPGSVGPALLAERRGSWTYVLFPTGSREEASCVLADEALDGGGPAGPGSVFSSSGENPDEPAPAARGLQEWTVATGATDEGLFGWVEGAVGAEVVGLTVTTGAGREVQASVAGGRFAAWWPAGRARLDSPQFTVGLQYRATFADGSSSEVRPS